MIEALISMVLMSIISLGMVHVTSKASNAQRDSQMQEIVVNQLRAALIKNKMGSVDICSTAPTVQLPNNVTLTASVQGCDGTTTAVINSVTINDVPKPISLSVTSDLIGGQIVVGGTWASI